MRYAIISDIHSNLEALEAVLADIRRVGVDEILCLGDIVGYGANPNECIALVRDCSRATVAGNHDYAAVGLTSTDTFNPYARAATEWTQRVLGQVEGEWLRSLPLTAVVEDMRLAHATPLEPAEWRYILHAADATDELLGIDERACFVGHSHLPAVFERTDGTTRLRGFGRLQLDGPGRYLVNVGSVGQPRDGNNNAGYAVVDSGAASAELRRVPYDISTAQAKILRAGLPRVLADRLERGE